MSSRLDFIDRPINPPGPHLFTVISLFAGCGGSSLGYKWAGGKVLAAVEKDKNAAETYRRNHEGTLIIERDVITLTGEELMQACGIKPRDLDVLDGSPPCQGFSVAGKRQMKDSRNQLFQEYVRLLRELQPKSFIMENVSGMIKGKMRLIFAEIIRELKASGYTVRAWLLNAIYFGVPQRRERIIFIGAREDIGIKPTCLRAQTSAITARIAIDSLVVNEKERAFLLCAGDKYVAYEDWERIPYGRSRKDLGLSGFNCVKFHPDRPANTVRKSDGYLTMHGAMHWRERRRFTVAEFRRFGGFPDAFDFGPDWANAVQQIGNSVPPRFMQAIAEHIRDTVIIPSHSLQVA